MPGFNGKTLRYQSLFPDAATVFAQADALVGAGVELSDGTTSVDLSNDVIKLSYNDYDTSSFSYLAQKIIDFNNSVSRIQSVALVDNVADPDLTSGDLSWTEDSVTLEIQRLNLPAGSEISLLVNFHPDASNDTFGATEAGGTIGNVLANDSDSNVGDTLTAATMATSQYFMLLANGDVVVNGDAVEAGNGPLQEVINYVALDGKGGESLAATLTVDIAPDTSDDYTYTYGNKAQTFAGDQVSAGNEDTAFTGSGNDTAYGFGGADNLYGESGDDKLYGGDGYDELFGGSGADYLSGGAGKDVLAGETGSDRLNGGADDDIFVISAGGRDFVEDFTKGEDLLQLNGVAFSSLTFSDVDKNGTLDSVVGLTNSTSVVLLNTGNMITVTDLFG